MRTQVPTAAISGIDANLVQVATTTKGGPHRMLLLLSNNYGAEVRYQDLEETKRRCHSAITSSDYAMEPRTAHLRLTSTGPVSVSPHFDLAIALGLLIDLDEIPPEAIEGRVFCGELGLDGSLLPLRGAASIAERAAQEEVYELILPAANAAEAAALPGVPSIIGAESLTEVIQHLWGDSLITPTEASPETHVPSGLPDLAEILGFEQQKRALELAAAGGHNVLFVGPMNAGATRLARRLPGILPPLTDAESIELTKIYSQIADEPLTALVRERPFRAPYLTSSGVRMSGGGLSSSPGEASLAHEGILFLHELPEFQLTVIEALLEPLAHGITTVVATVDDGGKPFPCLDHESHVLPARFLLVGFAEPTTAHRLPEALLRHFDLTVSISNELDVEAPRGESSARIADRVLAARAVQQQRYTDVPRLNATVPYDLLSPRLTSAAERLVTSLALGEMPLISLYRVAQTAADLEASPSIRRCHVEEAILYRTPESF